MFGLASSDWPVTIAPFQTPPPSSKGLERHAPPSPPKRKPIFCRAHPHPDRPPGSAGGVRAFRRHCTWGHRPYTTRPSPPALRERHNPLQKVALGCQCHGSTTGCSYCPRAVSAGCPVLAPRGWSRLPVADGEDATRPSRGSVLTGRGGALRSVVGRLCRRTVCHTVRVALVDVAQPPTVIGRWGARAPPIGIMSQALGDPALYISGSALRHSGDAADPVPRDREPRGRGGARGVRRGGLLPKRRRAAAESGVSQDRPAVVPSCPPYGTAPSLSLWGCGTAQC